MNRRERTAGTADEYNLSDAELERATEEMETVGLELSRVLAGKSSSVQGGVLAMAVAKWLGGHFYAGDRKATATLREDLLQVHVGTVRRAMKANVN